MSDILAKLAAPFRPDQIDWRIGSTTKDKTKGMALAYIDSRAVMHRLDEVCGPFWQCDYVPMPNGTYCCRIGIKIGDEWLWRANGAINYPESDKGDAKEMAAKGSYSDAFKRAAVLWGIGQYLYDIDSPWVDIVPKGASHVFADGVREKLDRMLSRGQAQPAPVQQAAPPAKMTPDQWVKNAIAEVMKAQSKAELDAWCQKHAKAIDKLVEDRPALARELTHKISEVHGEFEGKRAA